MRHALALVDSLKEYATRSGFDGVEIVLGPTAYADPAQDMFGFALAAGGFRLRQRWLNPMIPLSSDPEQALASVSSKRKRQYIRGALRDGVEVNECGRERLASFYEVLLENRARHDAVPTHTLEELQRIFELVPDRVRLFLCVHGGQLLGGILVFELSCHTVYTFYLAQRECFKEHQAPAVLVYRLLQYYGARGVRYLDLGPTGNYDFENHQLTLNAGNAYFKEEMGAVVFHRDRWVWQQS
jgi:lipid II:glycine glycyltransferase (peptidoglycan interpeptide bridge formation enzyme)